MSDPFKLIFIEAINYSLIIYSVILSLMVLLITPTLNTLYFVALLTLIVWFLCLWTGRIIETTADVAATLVGYGEGLLSFMSGYTSDLNFFQKLIDPHETFPKRIKRIQETLMNVQ